MGGSAEVDLLERTNLSLWTASYNINASPSGFASYFGTLLSTDLQGTESSPTEFSRDSKKRAIHFSITWFGVILRLHSTPHPGGTRLTDRGTRDSSYPGSFLYEAQIFLFSSRASIQASGLT